MLIRSRDLGGLDPTGYLFLLIRHVRNRGDPTMHRNGSEASGCQPAWKLKLRDLRNFHATLLLDDGFDIKTVSGRLTHARTSTTQDRYQARLPATDRRAAEHVADKLGRR